jgi:hypothetical protein
LQFAEHIRRPPTFDKQVKTSDLVFFTTEQRKKLKIISAKKYTD